MFIIHRLPIVQELLAAQKAQQAPSAAPVALNGSKTFLSARWHGYIQY
jgi:hypothetical protein